MSVKGRANQGERFRRRLVRAVAIPVFVMVALAGLLNAQIGYLLSVNHRVDHVNRVLSLGQQLESDLDELEELDRKHRDTRNPAFVQQYRAAAMAATMTLAKLREAERDEPALIRLLDRITEQLADWRREAAREVEATRATGVAEEASPYQEAVMDSAHEIVGQVLRAEERERDHEKGVAERTSWIVAAASLGLTLIAALYLAFYARRQVRRVSTRYEHAMWVAEEALRAREEFLIVASHELKTPLTALRLQVGSALRSLETRAQPPAYLAARIEAADRQAERLSHLVTALLDSSRVTAGKLELALEEVDLAALAREVVARSQERLRRAGCKVEVHAQSPVVGRWDRLRLDQAVTNLLANAMKYGRGKPIEITVLGDGERARFAIRDNGIGIEPRRRERIFERFERAVSLRHYGGFGLGLWFVRRIAAAQGGKVEVESRPGAGATFTIELPRSAVDESSDVAHAVARS